MLCCGQEPSQMSHKAVTAARRIADGKSIGPKPEVNNGAFGAS